MKETLVICGFPGVGKSHAASNLHDPYNGEFVIDSDSSKFPKDGFPLNYLKSIYFDYHVNKPTLLFVSSHADVREGLINIKIPYVLVYPDKGLLGEYIQRYLDRGSNKAFIDLLFTNWNEWIDGCEQEKTEKIKLTKGQFLIDAIFKLRTLNGASQGTMTKEQNPDKIKSNG
jgi:hypothetical protein